MKFIYCRRLKSQYFGAPKSGVLKMRGFPAVSGIAGCSYATGSLILSWIDDSYWSRMLPDAVL